MKPGPIFPTHSLATCREIIIHGQTGDYRPRIGPATSAATVRPRFPALFRIFRHLDSAGLPAEGRGGRGGGGVPLGPLVGLDHHALGEVEEEVLDAAVQLRGGVEVVGSDGFGVAGNRGCKLIHPSG